MSLETKIIILAQSIGADIKSLRNTQGDLTSLSTTAKESLVLAVNELHQLLASSTGIDDTAGAGNLDATWSASKIYATVEAAKTAVINSLVDGAGDALNTLNELAAAMGNDPNFAATIATEVANRVRFDSVQLLNAAQQLQACTNLGLGNPAHNFVADYITAKT